MAWLIPVYFGTLIIVLAIMRLILMIPIRTRNNAISREILDHIDRGDGGDTDIEILDDLIAYAKEHGHDYRI